MIVEAGARLRLIQAIHARLTDLIALTHIGTDHDLIYYGRFIVSAV